MTDVWLQLAEVYTRQGMQTEAVHAFKEIIARNPKDAGSLIGVAASLLRLGKLDEARKHGELAVSLAPAGAHEILAKIALARRDRADASSLASQSDSAQAQYIRATSGVVIRGSRDRRRS